MKNSASFDTKIVSLPIFSGYDLNLSYIYHTITHLAIWTMRKDFHVIFSLYMQKCNHVQILNGTWDGCGFLSHLSKSRCVRKLESCARFSPFRGVCLVVKLTGLGSLCLSKSVGVPRMCVGAVESGE